MTGLYVLCAIVLQLHHANMQSVLTSTVGIVAQKCNERRMVMNKCENCYHFDVCKNYLAELGYTLGVDYRATKCPFYKDKSLIGELPCKVGDVVYRIMTSHHTRIKSIKETKVCRIAVDADGIYLFCQHCAATKSVLGKNVFLSREEAEKKLKERE